VHEEEFDMVVAGGGPAGSTLAALVAMRGHRVLLVEKEHFPRYQIGESLLPATVHGVCRLLGIYQELEASEFTKKRGGTFRWGRNSAPWTFSFGELPAFAHGKSFAYQVERMRFDTLLLDNARRTGVEVREGCTAVGVLSGHDRAEGLSYVDQYGALHTVRAHYVADASGHRSRIFRAMAGQRHYSDFFRNIALFGYFENGKRLPEPDSGNILTVAFDNGWFWYIPLTATLTSVGAVVRHELARTIASNPGKALSDLITACPLINEQLANANRVTTGPYGTIRARRDWSYSHDRFHQPGMVLVGDTACFVDPVLSSGVHLATYGALLAARAVNTALAGTVPEQRVLAEFERRYRAEYGYFYRFLRGFYAQNVSEDSYFWQAKRLTGSALSDMVAFIELVGGVASGEPTLTDSDDGIHSYAARASQSGMKNRSCASALVPSADSLSWEEPSKIAFNCDAAADCPRETRRLADCPKC
jgi:FAD-dependent halogenase